MPISSLNRRPAAIVADAAGYTRPMDRDKAGTHGRLKIAVAHGRGPQDRPTFIT
jgi:hypothetical protein